MTATEIMLHQNAANALMRALMDNLAIVSTPQFVLRDDGGMALANALAAARIADMLQEAREGL